MKNRNNAFTIIELLIVVAIIGLLTALVVPTVAGAMSSSQKTGALNQIRQFSALAVAYAYDNNGALPDEGGDGVQSLTKVQAATNAWYNVLPPLGDLKAAKDLDRANFHTPQAPFFIKAANYPSKPGSNVYFAFGINSQLNGIRLTRIARPARTALFAEAALPDEKKLLPAGGATSDLGQPKVRDKRFVGRYHGAGIIGFADGHSEIIPVNKGFDTNVVIWEQP